MFGYACTETEALMPAPIFYSHLAILRRISELRRAGNASAAGLQPDAKSQVTLRYIDGKPVGATSVVVSIQHDEGMTAGQIKDMLRPIVKATLPEGWMPPDEEFYVNPTGNFVIGGPDGDCGLTGRKIIVDTYGGAARMAAARSPARTRPRWTARPPISAGTWRKTLSPPGSPTAAPCN